MLHKVSLFPVLHCEILLTSPVINPKISYLCKKGKPNKQESYESFQPDIRHHFQVFV